LPKTQCKIQKNQCMRRKVRLQSYNYYELGIIKEVSNMISDKTLSKKLDVFIQEKETKYDFKGIVDESIRYIEEIQLLKPELWNRFVNQYRTEADSDGGWRGEYWGKMMRGATFVYSYTQNKDLYDILYKTVEDMIAAADNLGRISTYPVNSEFSAWDMWSRKYVLLGMQYFMEICTDSDFNKKITESMQKQVDYIISKIGDKEDGKTPITSTSDSWGGLNSSSILEPVMKLYNITKEKRYLDFASHIVNEGGADNVNIFELAYDNKLYPYQYPVTKAYEMTSCFEGLLEYYKVTGNEKHRDGVINFADRILESDFTIIGCCGCAGECLDNSTISQTNPNKDQVMQETCVTVTMMKFFYNLNCFTGDSKYADAFERSMYNAFLGAINTENSIGILDAEVVAKHPDVIKEPLPFDSYSPLTAGIRGLGTGGMRVMSDNSYYGCCACIGAAGNGLTPKMSLLTSEDGLVVNLYIGGKIFAKTMSGNNVTIDIQTEYPKNGDVRIKIEPQSQEEFDILLRNPSWSRATGVSVNGIDNNVNDGYIRIRKLWQKGDIIELKLDMRTQAIYPEADADSEIKYIALRRGPLVLAQESRLGYNVNDPVSIAVKDDGYVDVELPEKDIAPYKHILEVLVPLAEGGKMTVTDYASAGKLWTEESKMAAWMLVK